MREGRDWRTMLTRYGSLQVERLTIQYLMEVFGLLSCYVKETMPEGVEISPVRIYQAAARYLTQDEHRVYGLMVEGGVLGGIITSSLIKHPLLVTRVYLDNLYIDQECRGPKAVGSLLRAAVNDAADSGYSVIQARVKSDEVAIWDRYCEKIVTYEMDIRS